MKTTGLTLLWLCFIVVVDVNAQRALQKYSVDRSKISVSGLSSGGGMATQLHVAYSSLFMGAGILAGMPYYCAEGNIDLNRVRCTLNPDDIDIDELVSATDRFASFGDIDATSNMFNSRVFLFNGLIDTAINPGMGLKFREYYSHYVTPDNIITVFNISAEHTFPTIDYGNPCYVLGSPYIGKCDYNAAYETLNAIYPGLKRPKKCVLLKGDFYEFDQAEFFAGSSANVSMDDIGFVYVPSRCMSAVKVCRLHVSCHGCLQGRWTLGDVFARKTGYNEVGELNNIIILYPQVKQTAFNLFGCWDWWGYSDTTSDHLYATKRGQQSSVIVRMIDRLS